MQWLLLRRTGSRPMGFSSCGSWALEHGFSSCGAWAQLLRGMWHLPGPGTESMFSALAGGFSSTAPSDKSFCYTFNRSCPTLLTTRARRLGEHVPGGFTRILGKIGKRCGFPMQIYRLRTLRMSPQNLYFILILKPCIRFLKKYRKLFF